MLMKIDALACKKLSCIVVAMSLIASPASAIAEESESVVSSSETSEVASESTNEVVDEVATSEAVGVTDSEIETNDSDYQDNVFISSSLLSVESTSPALTLQSDEDIANGEYCGLTWKITSDGVLVLGDGTEQTYGTIPVATSTPQPWSSYATSITSVEVDGIVHATSNSLIGFLSGATNLLSVDFDGLDTSGATTMSNMFYGCSNAAFNPNVSQLDTSSVTDISKMFYNCSGTAFNPDVSKWDTSNVTTMSNAFTNCHGDVFNPDVSLWDTSKVTNMSSMFSGCYGAIFNPDVSQWNTSSVTNMGSMFANCRGAAFNPNVSEWNTSHVTIMSSMFSACYGAAFNPDVSKWDTSNVKNMLSMFTNCFNSVFNPDVSQWNTSHVTSMNYMFSNCRGAAFNPNVSKWDVSSVMSMSSMFSGCYGENFNPDVSQWDTSSVTTMSGMFSGCRGAAFSPNVSQWNTSKVTNMSSMFANCQKLESLDVSKFDTAKVTNMSSMFSGCLALTSINLSNFDMSLSSSTYNSSTKSFGIKSMLANCTALSSIKLGENNVLYASGDVNGTGVTTSVELPDAPTNDDYQGKWWIDGGTGYTATDLMSSYDGSTMAGTYEWMPTAYTITYVAPDGLLFGNGGQTVTISVIKNSSFEVSTGNELLEDDAYYVTSWNTQADGSGVTYEEGITYIPTSDVTLYAITEMGATATGKTDTHNLDSDGDGYGDNISFSVPTSIYGYVNSDGSVFVNDSDFYIENCSSEDISIKYVTSDGWDSRVNIVDDASSSATENAMSITMEPVTSEASLLMPIKNGSKTLLYDETTNPSWKVGSGSFTSPAKLYIDVEMNVANASDGLFSYEPMKIGSMHWYCQIAKYADAK